MDSTIQRISRLTPVDAVLAVIQSGVTAVAPRQMPLAEACGAVLAKDAQVPQCPATAIALRDGFAVAAAEIADAGPYAPTPLSLTARRIDTGDLLPRGTDAVAPLDSITLRGTRAEAIAAVAPGEGVLPAGGDTAPGAALRRAGERLRALDLAVLAAAGMSEVTVRSPRIAIARAGALKGQMHDAAQAALNRWATRAGCAVRETSSLAQALQDDQCDAVIGIGGTGSGRRDDAVQDLARLGRVEVHGIAISPGETAALGFVDERPVLLAPGRFDAALAVWLLIGRPLAARLAGTKLAGGNIDEQPITAALKRKVTSALGMTEVIPVHCEGGTAEPLASGYLTLTALARSDGWIVVAAESEGFAAGSAVAVNRWS
jgi:molybdopterin biosynthesis enzyme